MHGSSVKIAIKQPYRPVIHATLKIICDLVKSYLSCLPFDFNFNKNVHNVLPSWNKILPTFFNVSSTILIISSVYFFSSVVQFNYRRPWHSHIAFLEISKPWYCTQSKKALSNWQISYNNYMGKVYHFTGNIVFIYDCYLC